MIAGQKSIRPATRGALRTMAVLGLAGVLLLCGVGLAIPHRALADSNDMFANPYSEFADTPPGEFYYGDAMSNLGYSSEAGEPLHAGESGGKSAWYYWTAPSNGLFKLDTFGSEFDTLIGVYTGSAVNALSYVASNDDYDSSTSDSLVVFRGVAGTTYRIAIDGYGGQSGTYLIHWEFSPDSASPVWRFYNMKNGSHFYTASAAEASVVLTRLDRTYSYDGPSYTLNTLNPLNNAPLYRFYNRRNGSHFYTSDPAEKSRVQNTLGATYSYDGIAYRVCMTRGVAGATTVWRLYNRKIGSHLYTADAAERDYILAKYPKTYSLDGESYYLAP